ncbi:RNA helicase Mov10l1 [Lampris incognitus]|uniref:RNA helicase Mov10l1 n=1 Tax=Lampris incognitus TaxID=2546036 RepID=UPI0024B4EACA|nr:RNA helicase Mov10l1 [Lampris incognitus]
MFAALRGLLARILPPLWRTATEEDDAFLMEATVETRKLQHSVVTQLGPDYGLIDDVVYFTSREVLGGVPLKVGDRVNGIAAQEGAQGGWKALRLEKDSDAWEDESCLEAGGLKLHPLIGKVTSFDGSNGFINDIYFLYQSLCEGYVPVKGDWVQAQYSISPLYTTEAHSVAPLRYRRLDQLCVTSVSSRSGVVGDSVFFSRNSLLLPAHYQPQPGDLVNLVVVESSQSIYSWRALCMAPTKCSTSPSTKPVLNADIQSLLRNKGGLDVSFYAHFGDLELGESLDLVLWIQNRGSQTHTLKCCEFAGWDLEHQFTVRAIKEATGKKMPRSPAVGSTSSPDPAPLKQGVSSMNEGDQENGEVRQRPIPKSAGRKEKREVAIAPGQRLSVVLRCTAKNLGRCSELLLLHFSSFTIGRRLEVKVASKDECLLKPRAPYCPRNDALLASAPPTSMITIPAPPLPVRLKNRHLPSFMGIYTIPRSLRDCLKANFNVLAVEPCLGEALSLSNMRARFSTLLWLEELQAEKEMQEFTIIAAVLKKGASYLHLEIPGLSEGRPNLAIGDKVTLKESRQDGMLVEYIGCIAEIQDENVGFRVNQDFKHNYLGEPLDVEFTYNRQTMRRCHQALTRVEQFGQSKSILFPTKLTFQAPQWTGKWLEDSLKEETTETNEVTVSDDGESMSSISVDMKSTATGTKVSKHPSKPGKGKFFRPDLNPSQRQAVKMILAGESRPIPYVLFGPPGTGKTITLIETILQVYHFLPSSRVLVCTPSNSAADLICIRLHDSGYIHAGNLVRVNASCRQYESIPELVRKYSKAGEDIHCASFYRIVVSTCSSAGMFHFSGVQAGHFTHLFLDEAGQATEPEALIPISLMSVKDGQVVLAGDPCQLGPVVRSKLASTFGLGISLLERLMASPLYSRQDGGYNPKLVTKLICTYRSHEALMQLSSRLFYEGELCTRAPRDIVDSLCCWKELPNKGFPLIFHGVRGTELREGNSPSWFNPAEAVQVMLYCCKLAKKLCNPVDVSDIGIISPYKKQTEKIRVLLGRVGLLDIKVGSVEEFQGQEFLVIILSTVRSNESLGSDNLQGILGFLTNPKRFNVAVTRPKALLIIVGNPHILIKDTCYRNLLEYSFENRAFIGCDPPPALLASHTTEL